MKNILLLFIVAAVSFAGCNKKTAPETKVTPAAKTTTEKKPATLDELKGKPVQVKELHADKKEDVMKANSEVKDALLEEGSYKSYYESGYAKHNSGDFQNAISDFSKSIELNPNYSDAYNFRGMSKYKSGDKSGACSDWKRAAELGNSGASEMAQRYCQ